ncbi:hypothetical protein M4Z63_24015, partial [Escherichia coli]|nr:hypothetical protein [Escherichia coli]
LSYQFSSDGYIRRSVYAYNYPASSKRYQLTDIDGEDAFIRIGSIAMVRVPLDAMEPVEEDDE